MVQFCLIADENKTLWCCFSYHRAFACDGECTKSCWWLSVLHQPKGRWEKCILQLDMLKPRGQRNWPSQLLCLDGTNWIYICFSDARVINAYGRIICCCMPQSRHADCVVQRYWTGVTSEVSRDWSLAPGCNLVLVEELGQIASLSSSLSLSLHENKGADPCCKAPQELWAKTALQELCAVTSGAWTTTCSHRNIIS